MTDTNILRLRLIAETDDIIFDEHDLHDLTDEDLENMLEEMRNKFARRKPPTD